MSSDDEVSPGGSNIFRHEAAEREWTAPEHAEAEEIEEHLARFIGEASWVFHEIVSDLVHLDVHIVEPTAERDWWTLFTTGMSALPMTVPEGCEALRYAELMVMLPADWKVREMKVTPPPPDLEQWYWPIRWLKQLARLPHDYGTWIGFGHTIPNGDPAEPFAPDTKLCGWALIPPITIPDEGRSVELSDGREVHFYCLHAVHHAEMSLKLNKGMDALLDAFEKHDVSEVLDLNRKPATRRKLFGLF
jgi:Suppressor of fused protein (SUFU)